MHGDMTMHVRVDSGIAKKSWPASHSAMH
jgi:hypothetical protein